METERIALSQRERDRLRVLHEVKRKQITQIEAARRLKISDRHIRRLLVGLRKLGDRAVLHGLRGRPSNRRLAARFEQPHRLSMASCAGLRPESLECAIARGVSEPINSC